MTMKKIGIMGGTFDPIHNGHIMLGRQAYEEYDLDCIWYMPSRIPPHKKDHTITAAKDRLAMTAAAIAPYPYFKLSDFELRRIGGNTYTADTLRLLKEEYPDVEFSLSRAQTQLWTLKNGIIPNMFFQPSHFWRQQESMRRRIVRWMSRFPI